MRPGISNFTDPEWMLLSGNIDISAFLCVYLLFGLLDAPITHSINGDSVSLSLKSCKDFLTVVTMLVGGY